MEAKDAIDKAVEYLKSFFPNADKLILEEIELSDDDKYWSVTLSFSDTAPTQIGTAHMWNPTQSRLYKIFKIDAESKEVRSMKIRELA